MHPGTVRTDLSKAFWENVVSRDRLFEIEWVAERLVALIERMGDGELGRGRCWDYDGREVPP
jgi:hypothetical protein